MRGGLAALLAHAGLVVWLTWPFAAHVATHLPRAHDVALVDPPYTAWVLAFETHALTTAPFDLLDANIYHPARGTLFYGPTAFGALPYFAPVLLASGNPILALNLAYLGGVVLTAWTVHLVVRRWTGSWLAGFTGGWAVLTNRWVLWSGSLAPHLAVLQYLPLIVALGATALDRRRGPLVLAGLVALQCLTDPLYVAPVVVAPLALVAVVRLTRRASRPAGLRMVGALAVAIVLLLPVYGGYLAVRAGDPDLDVRTVWTSAGERVGLLPWDLLRGAAAIPGSVWGLITVGGLVAGWRAWRGRRPPTARAWAHAVLWTALGLLLSVPPEVSWGRYANRITLPQTLVAEWVPAWGLLRMPSRLGVAALVGLALLAGLAFAECARTIPTRGRWGALGQVARSALAVALALAFYRGYRDGAELRLLARPALPASYPLAPMTLPAHAPLVDTLRRSNGPVLYLPVGPAGTTPHLHAEAMLDSTAHWRPLLNGYSSYWPAGFRERMAVANRLPDPAAVAQLRDEAGLESIVVRLGRGGYRTAGQPGAWALLAEQGGREDLPLVARDGATLLFAVRGTPAPRR